MTFLNNLFAWEYKTSTGTLKIKSSEYISNRRELLLSPPLAIIRDAVNLYAELDPIADIVQNTVAEYLLAISCDAIDSGRLLWKQMTSTRLRQLLLSHTHIHTHSERDLESE